MWGQTTSNDIAQWGQFGDFFGGILNPIISLVSLIILAYLTVMISKNDKEENRKQLYLEMKLKLYNELLDQYNELGKLRYTLFKCLNEIKDKPYNYELMEGSGYKIIILEGIDKFKKFSDFMWLFNLRCDFIYNYDFSCGQYQRLMKELGELEFNLSTAKASITSMSAMTKDYTAINRDLFSHLQNFMRSLNQEIKKDQPKN